MNSGRMLDSVSDGFDWDDMHDPIPELDDAEKELVLEQIDPDWVAHYTANVDAAWEAWYETSPHEMDQLSIEIGRAREEDRRYAMERMRELDDALRDVGTPFMLKRQAD